MQMRPLAKQTTKTSRDLACMVHTDGAVTSNQTLIQWLPARKTIVELLAAMPEHCTQPRAQDGHALIRVTYQSQLNVTWQGETKLLAGRTLEEAFALQNLVWCQDDERANLKLLIRGNARLSLDQLAERLHKRVKSSEFNKTDFALALLAQNPASWTVPTYIENGLLWLQDEIAPTPAVATPQAVEVAA